jgi:hypothetical protein
MAFDRRYTSVKKLASGQLPAGRDCQILVAAKRFEGQHSPCGGVWPERFSTIPGETAFRQGSPPDGLNCGFNNAFWQQKVSLS